MRRSNVILLLFEPSLVSGTFTVISTILLLVLSNISYLLKSGLFYDAIFGQNSPIDLIARSNSTATSFNQAIFGNPLLNRLLFFGFWMMIGLFVYVTITYIGQSFADTESEIKSLGYVHARKTLIEKSIFVRIAIRAGGVLGAFLYGWVFVRFLLPFCILAFRVGLSTLSSYKGYLYLLLSTSVLLVSIHLFVIIARIVSARPRVFGGWDSLLLE